MGNVPLRIEILTSISGVNFDECYSDRVVDTIDGVEVSIISLPHLKANKQASGRYKGRTWRSCGSTPGARAAGRIQNEAAGVPRGLCNHHALNRRTTSRAPRRYTVRQTSSPSGSSTSHHRLFVCFTIW